jgi:hypothetical protein
MANLTAVVFCCLPSRTNLNEYFSKGRLEFF